MLQEEESFFCQACCCISAPDKQVNIQSTWKIDVFKSVGMAVVINFIGYYIMVTYRNYLCFLHHVSQNSLIIRQYCQVSSFFYSNSPKTHQTEVGGGGVDKNESISITNLTFKDLQSLQRGLQSATRTLIRTSLMHKYRARRCLY